MNKHFHPPSFNASHLLTLNIIGCGKVGKTLGKLFAQTKLVEIGGIINSTIASAKRAATFITHGVAYATFDLLPPADIYLITTPDDIIADIAKKIAQSGCIAHPAVIIHCSGALSSQILAPVKSLGCYTASIHPLKSFADPTHTVKNFAGTLCAIEGDEIALSIMRPLLKKMKAEIFACHHEKKILYHAASVLANNYLTTLHYQAMQCYQQAGLSEKLAKAATSTLMHDALANLNHLPHHLALTGPIQRGDLKTIKKHQASLRELNTHQGNLLAELYTLLGLNTLTFANLSAPKKLKIAALLNASSNNYLNPNNGEE